MKPRRKSLRLPNYDYASTGAYFVTICARDRVCLFGEVDSDRMIMNPLGVAVSDVWRGLPDHYPHVRLDVFVVMPNHVHGILFLTDAPPVGAGLKPAPTTGTGHGLPEIVRGFKTFSSRRINAMRSTPGEPVWQRGYYDHVIRNERSLESIRQYVIDNPRRWTLDRENPNRLNPGDRPRAAGESAPWEGQG